MQSYNKFNLPNLKLYTHTHTHILYLNFLNETLLYIFFTYYLKIILIVYFRRLHFINFIEKLRHYKERTI